MTDVLDALVPEPQTDGDWDDVLRRAGVTSRRRRTLLAVAVAVVVAAVAAPALALLLGWVDRKDVSFSKGKPAPNVVKKQFADLGVGAPPQFAPAVQAAKAREVGRFRVRGKLRALWVAPTKDGGFCFTWDGLFGGCRRGEDRDAHTFAVGFGGALRLGEAPRITSIEGEVTDPDAARIELVYADGARKAIPFVYVSKPIDAGFFSAAIPRDRQNGKRRPVRAVLLDGRGDVIARESVPEPRPLQIGRVPRAGERRVRTLPTKLSLPPSEPVQRASGDGATVVVGANGIATWTTSGVTGERARLLRATSGVSYTCFRLTREFGIFDSRALGIEGKFAPVAAVRYVGLGRPLDGCEIGGEYGHRWPDRFASHAPVEIPLTVRGRRWFDDRAGARDLALFVRSRRVQQIRKEPPAQALRDLRVAYPQLARSRIRIDASGGRLVFREGRFRVVVERGRIVSQNLKPYAFVF